MDRRIGKFKINFGYIENEPASVKELMGQCIVIRAEHLAYDDTVEYIAISDMFDVVEIGQVVPLYEMLILNNGNWQAVKIDNKPT